MTFVKPGTSILKVFELRAPLILLTLVLPFAALAQAAPDSSSSFKQQRPFLFEIKKDGKVSHILGSMHAGILMTSFPDVAFELAAQSKNMAFEADPEAFLQENREAIQAASLYPDGDSLDQHLSPKAIAKLRDILDTGQGIEHLMKYRPWAIAAEISSQSFDGFMKGEPNGLWDVLKGIDVTLLKKSKQAGKSITYLDDLSHAVEEFNEETSAADLEKLLSYPDPGAHLLRCVRMAQGSYLAGDEAGFQRYNELCENEKFLKRSQERTKSWVPKLDPLFKTGGAFVVVGADHLSGPNGLTALLTAKGYKVQRLGPKGTPAVETAIMNSTPSGHQ